MVVIGIIMVVVGIMMVVVGIMTGVMVGGDCFHVDNDGCN